MIQLYIPTPRYNELDTVEAGDLNDLNPEHELRYEIESYIRNELWDEEAELDDIIKHEPPQN